MPLTPPVLPQLARPAKSLPSGTGWAYEPKWDGFRVLAFVGGRGPDPDVYLQSRNGKPLRRYFPEVDLPAVGRYVLDGEIVLFDDRGRQDFDALGQRVHPAKSRIDRLARETPVRFIAFDLLELDGEDLLALPYDERRLRLEQFAGRHAEGHFDLTPAVQTPAEAEGWLTTAEGVIAKQRSAPYKPGERVGMVKVKRVRTMDAVVLGWRPGKEERTVGSLVLGLHGEDGRLREVGHTSGFKAAEKRELVDTLAPYETGETWEGEPSRWNQGRELSGRVLRPELVVEVSFDHASNGRIRHGAKILRWRTDKDPADCLVDQLDQ